MRSYWIRMAPKANMIGVLVRKGEDTERHREESHVTAETDIE